MSSLQPSSPQNASEVCKYWKAYRPFFKLFTPSSLDAVHRYYESRRRLFNDSQPSRVVKSKEAKKNSKKQSLRKQVQNNNMVES